MSFQAGRQGDAIAVDEGEGGGAGHAVGRFQPPVQRVASGIEVANIDFRRGENGSGRVILRFNGDGAAADITVFDAERQKAIETIVDDQLGPIRMPAPSPKLSDTPGRIRWAGQVSGAANDEVFGEWLGMSRAEIDALRQQKVI